MTSVGSGYSGKPSEAIRSDGHELAKKAPEDHLEWGWNPSRTVTQEEAVVKVDPTEASPTGMYPPYMEHEDMVAEGTQQINPEMEEFRFAPTCD